MQKNMKTVENCKKLLGDNISKIRKVKKMSQTEFAELVCVNRSYLSGLEKGMKNPSITMLFRIAGKLQISVKQLLTDYTFNEYAEIFEEISKNGPAVLEESLNYQLFGKLRRENNLLQEKLAEQTGLSRNHISGIERGIYRPTLMTLAKMAMILGCDITDFFR